MGDSFGRQLESPVSRFIAISSAVHADLIERVSADRIENIPNRVDLPAEVDGVDRSFASAPLAIVIVGTSKINKNVRC